MFDNWAEYYAPGADATPDAFPFAGYARVLDEVVSLAHLEPEMRVLDLGIGTGNLAARFLHAGCRVWGIDFSMHMLAQTRAQLPQVNLIQADLLAAWPLSWRQPFARVVSAYVFHEFDLAIKLSLLQRIARHYLAPRGQVLIADIAFPTADARAAAARRWAADWDEDEHYWAADEVIAASAQIGLQVTYRQVSSCGGVFVFTVKETGV